MSKVIIIEGSRFIMPIPVKNTIINETAIYAHINMNMRELRGCFIISVKAQAKKFEMDLFLSRGSIAMAM